MRQISVVAAPVIALIAGSFTAGAALAATAEDRAAIMQSCSATLQMSESQCTCIADLAESDLSDKEYEVFVAAVSDVEQMNATIASAGLSGDEAMSVMNFLATSPTQCQGG